MSLSRSCFGKICHLANIPDQYMALGIAAVSLFALAGALTAQYGFHLRPCELCLFQRVPFVMGIFLGLWAYFSKATRLPLIAASGVVFLVNSAIALFHSGVERKWWVGLTGCTTPDMSGSIEDLMSRIQNTDVVRCDEIPWSFLGLSMANYNVFFCLGLGVLCLGYALHTIKSKE
ncbi:MAG TPA: disulfide bond formation protein B [Rhodospirillaceae bacterium]|nr:disulfide bond formation protein B [Rhodospirillaceae bacterium]